MRTTRLATPFSLAVTSVVAVLCLGRPAPAQPFEWQTATPASQGLSAPKLDALRDDLAARKTRALLVIRNDKIVCEWYAPGNAADGKQGTASLAKAVVGGLSLAVALTDGRVRLDDAAAQYVPEWKDDPKKSKITLRHLGSHTSGLSDSTADGVKNEDQPGWKGDFWKRLPPPNDPFTLARDKAPVLFEPGRQLQYSNPGSGMLTYCVTAALKDAERRDVRSLLKERVMRPIGVADAEWSAGYRKPGSQN
jgi:CubicO group peptidase (beta-lactamase class C family)